jgi:hypothetical protein
MYYFQHPKRQDRRSDSVMVARRIPEIWNIGGDAGKFRSSHSDNLKPSRQFRPAQEKRYQIDQIQEAQPLQIVVPSGGVKRGASLAPPLILLCGMDEFLCRVSGFVAESSGKKSGN